VGFVDANVLLCAMSRDSGEPDKARRGNEVLTSPTWRSPYRIFGSATSRRDRRDVRRRVEPWCFARSLGCEVVLSEDLSDGEDYAGVRVQNPFG